MKFSRYFIEFMWCNADENGKLPIGYFGIHLSDWFKRKWESHRIMHIFLDNLGSIGWIEATGIKGIFFGQLNLSELGVSVVRTKSV